MSDWEDENYDESLAKLPNTKQGAKTNYIDENDERDGQNDGKIKIDIDSVEKLASNLAYTAQQLEHAADKFQSNNDFQKVVKVLENLKVGEIDELDQRINQSIKKIDINFLSKKIGKEVESQIKKIEIPTEKLEKYAQVIDGDEIDDVMEEITELQNFRDKFKFKSIIFASVLSLSVGFIFSYFVLNQIFDLKLQAAKTEIFNEKSKLLSVLKNKNITVFTSSNEAQIVFQSAKKFEYFKTKDGRDVIQFSIKD